MSNRLSPLTLSVLLSVGVNEDFIAYWLKSAAAAPTLDLNDLSVWMVLAQQPYPKSATVGSSTPTGPEPRPGMSLPPVARPVGLDRPVHRTGLTLALIDGADGTDGKLLEPLSVLPASFREWFQRNCPSSSMAARETAWRAFTKYCQATNLSPLPASPLTVATFVAHSSDRGLAGSTIKSYLAGVNFAHAMAGYSSFASEGIVKSAARVAVNRAGPPKQSTAFTKEELCEIASALEKRNSWEAERDGALLFTSVLGMLRGSELVALQWADVEWKWPADSKSAPLHVELNIRKSKTDQAGLGQTVCIAESFGKYCAASWLRRWQERCLKTPFLNSRWVFPSVSGLTLGSHLSVATVRKRFKAMATGVDVDAKLVGSHTGRRTGATLAAESQATLTQIMAHGRWKSDAVHRYFKPTTREKLAASAAILGYEDTVGFGLV